MRHEHMKRLFSRLALFLGCASLLFGAGGCDFLTGEDQADATGLFPVLLDGRWGYINSLGRMVIEPQFYAAEAFSDDLAHVRTGSGHGFIDRDGDFVIEPRFEDARSFSDGLAAVRMDGRWGYLNRSGTFEINPQFTSAHAFSEGRAFVRTLDYDWEYIDTSGEIVRDATTPDLDEVDEPAFSDGLALVRHGDTYGYIDRAGKLVIPLQYSAARAFADRRAAVKISDRWGYIDDKKSTAISPQFISAASFSDDRAPVRKDGNQWGYIDRSGSLAIAAQFDEAMPFSEGRAPVMVDEKWGYIDPSGAYIIEPQFDEAMPFKDGAARVRINVGERQTYGYIDRDGKFLWYPTD